MLHGASADSVDAGTLFIPDPTLAFNNVQLAYALYSFYTPSLVGAPGAVQEVQLDAAIAGLLVLYPQNPVQGSPYNTGNETFGLKSGYKRAASLSECAPCVRECGRRCLRFS